MPTSLSDRILQSGVSKVSRPIPWPNVSVGSGTARGASSQAAFDFNRSIANNVNRVNRPFASTANTVSLYRERAAIRAEQAALKRAAELAARRAEASAVNAARQGAMRRTAAAIGQRVAVGAGRVGGFASRLPVAGPALAKLSPWVPKAGPFFVLAGLQLIPSVMEYFAPDVQSWLLGGWKGRGQGDIPPNAGGIDTSAKPGVSYTVQEFVTFGDGSVSSLQTAGPYTVINSYYFAKEGDTWFRYRNTSATNGGTERREFGKTPPFRNYFVRVFSNGVELTPAPFVIRPGIVANPPGKSATPQTPKDNAQSARDKALAVAALTGAAGLLGAPGRPLPNPAKNQDRKVGQAPGSAGQPDPAPEKTPFPSSDSCKGNACGSANLDASKANTEKLDDLLKYLQALGIGDIRATVNRIDEKVGPQLTDEFGRKTGLAGAALNTIERVKKVGSYLQFDRALNLLTFAATVHNAAMLSNNLIQTLEGTLSNALAAIGIKDTEGNALDISNVVGKTVQSAITSAIGAENYTSLSAAWKRANRIYQAGANVLYSVQSLRFSLTNILETIGGWNARVGNALKKWGVVGGNAYGWMPPSPNFDSPFFRAIENSEQVLSNIDNVASEALSIQETVTQLGTQKTALTAELTTGAEKAMTENQPVKAAAAASKAASVSPNIEATDLQKPGGV
jgi:hypothetical protein